MREEEMQDADQVAEQIAARAYALWEAQGRPEGRDQEFWFAAEQELMDAEGAADEMEDDEPVAPMLSGAPIH